MKKWTAFPVEDLVDLMEDAEEKWYECKEEDWKEAFSHHSEIGGISSLKNKFTSTNQWTVEAQSGAIQASEKILRQLADGHKAYEEKFGYSLLFS